MAEARSKHHWGQTSALLAMLANVHRDPNKRQAFKPADFNPHLRRRRETVGQVGISALKIFVQQQVATSEA